MFPGFQLRTLTIRTPARAVKSAARNAGTEWFTDQKKGESNLKILMLLDFSIDESLNDGTQKFLGNNVNDLGAHLIEDSLYNSLDKGGIWRHRR